MDNVPDIIPESSKAELIRKLYTDNRSKSSWVGLNTFVNTSKFKDAAEVKAALQSLDAYNVNQKIRKTFPRRAYKVNFQSWQFAMGICAETLCLLLVFVNCSSYF